MKRNRAIAAAGLILGPSLMHAFNNAVSDVLKLRLMIAIGVERLRFAAKRVDNHQRTAP